MKAFTTRTLAPGALTLLIAACGGTGDEPLPPTAAPPQQQPDPRLELSGTAATGLALAGSSVAVKCASGTAATTTGGTGQYALTFTRGALPCMVQVTGTVDGASITLHSLAETGSTDDGVTTAVANVTPLTEMIVAQMAATLPSELFASFGAGSAVTAEQVQAATNALLGVLKDVTGIDPASIDPFKAPLVAATSSNSNGGNAHDQLLDSIGQVFPPGSLAVVTSEIAKASASGDGSTAALAELVASADPGAMPSCAAAKSGALHAIASLGASAVHHVDFKSLSITGAQDHAVARIQPLDPARPCEFIATGSFGGMQHAYSIFMGPAGAGAFRLQKSASDAKATAIPDPDITGHTIGPLRP